VSCQVSEVYDDWMLTAILLSSGVSTSVVLFTNYYLEHFYSVITVQDNKKS